MDSPDHHDYVDFSIISSKRDTPTRFWRCFKYEDFEFSTMSNVYIKAKFRSSENLASRNQLTLYANKYVALKDVKKKNHNFIQEQYGVSHEISCNLILHPHIINYIGGIYFSNPERIGPVLEYIPVNLRNALSLYPQLSKSINKLKVAKQIASGMNFLHSLNPQILHRDLRTCHILINENLECKISEFSTTFNLRYSSYSSFVLYTFLIPPECKQNLSNFTSKSDVYMYGWILAELSIGDNFIETAEFYSQLLQKVKSKTKPDKLRDIIFSCLEEHPRHRLNFNQVLQKLNFLLKEKIDLELIAQNNQMEILEKAIKYKNIKANTCDALGRTLVHQCCIFGNLSMLEYLVSIWGKEVLTVKDNYLVSCTHLAARNGNLKILEFLLKHNTICTEKEMRFEVSALDLCIVMQHNLCCNFIIPHLTQASINFALLTASSEGNLEIVEKLVNVGGDLECRTIDTGSTPLERSSYHGHLDIVKFLVQKGSIVNQTRTKDGITPFYSACQNCHTNVAEYLIQCGADINLCCNDSTSPLIISSFNGHASIVSLLLKYNVNCSHLFHGKTAMQWAETEDYQDVLMIFKNIKPKQK